MQFEHRIAKWEIKWGRLGLRSNLSLLSVLQSKKFTMVIEDTSYHNRTIDRAGRVWVGVRALEHFRPDDIVIIELKNDILYVRKKM